MLLPIITKLVEKLFPDKVKQAKAKAELMEVMYKAQAEEYKAKGEIIKAEATGKSWMQRNWRPSLMFTFIAIIVNNYILVPYLQSFGVPVISLAVPSEMWTLLSIGVGGYVVGRSGEKIAQTKFDNERYFDTLRDLYGNLAQKDVDKHNQALKKAKE
jgi:hypothetical protein